MAWGRRRDVHTQCYPSGGGGFARIAGYVLIGLGVLVILICVPFWAWLAILGAALILTGLLLLRKQS